MEDSIQIQDSNSTRSQTSISRRKKWSLGLLMLSIVVLFWVLSSFLINEIFEKDLYRKPFFITYLNTAIFAFYLLPLIRKIYLNYRINGIDSLTYENIEIEFLENNKTSNHKIIQDEESSFGSIDQDTTNSVLTLSETIKLSAQFCIIWFIANLTTNASLSYTSVGSQTILSSTSSFFTLLIGSLAKTEKFNKIKIFGLILSFLGVIIITKIDSDNAVSNVERTKLSIFYGNLLALIGAFSYGIYTTLLKYKIKDDSRINMKIFFGFVGIFNIILLWPSLIFFHITGLEKFELPSGFFVLTIIALNCLITFVSDFFWVKAMLLTSPLTVTVGLSTTIPLAMFGDFIFKHEKFTFVYLLAASMIGISFFVINKDEENDKHVD